MKILLKSAHIVNEGKVIIGDVLISQARIEKIGESLSDASAQEWNAEGLHLFPGLIDDQVHFREPGLTHKADLYSESRAAVAGGITSFMEMPNTSPQTLTQELLEWKYQRAAQVSLANYSFFMGASNDNLTEVLKTNPENVCGIKVFMGSSTGNMLVDNAQTLENIFSQVDMLIATHCESEAVIQANLAKYKAQFGEQITPAMHPLIRNAEACYESSSQAVALAKKHNTRLHILHISTEKELDLFENKTPLEAKRITAEACIHHLWFSDEDYAEKGNWIKWNPAVKTKQDRNAIRAAVLDGRIDVIATDHAPHTIAEKEQHYMQAPSGGPLVQHSLQALLDLYHQGVFSLEQIAEKTSHNVAKCFQLRERGFIREGYFADLVLVDLKAKESVQKEGLLYKCGWSPFLGHTFSSQIITTFVNGIPVWNQGKICSENVGMRLGFR